MPTLGQVFGFPPNAKCNYVTIIYKYIHICNNVAIKYFIDFQFIRITVICQEILNFLII